MVFDVGLAMGFVKFTLCTLGMETVVVLSWPFLVVFEFDPI